MFYKVWRRFQRKWAFWLPRILKQLYLEEHRLFLGLTIIIGLMAGLAAVLFHLAIEGLHLYLFGGLDDPSLLRLILVPTFFSLVAGVLLWRYFPEARGSGVPQTKAAYLLRDGNIPLKVPLGKFLTGVLCIGAGHSMGREGPSLQIGAGLASWLGRVFHLSAENVKKLVPVGGAAAIGAAFNTPIAAVLFALEEIVGDLNAALLGSTILASVSATVLARSILGDAPLFAVPGYELSHWAELFAYAGLGVIGGLVSVAFSRLLLWTRKEFFKLPRWSVPLQPALGGLAIGILAAVMVWAGSEWTVMGVGYEEVGQALNNDKKMVLGVLLALGLAKIFATIVSYASGNAGGIFAPSLYIGAMLGGAVGVVVNNLALFQTASPGAYALVGMGSLFAGIVRAPMTSIFMMFELTQDYEIVMPLMIANMISYSISRHYQPIPLYHALLVQDRVHVPLPGKTAPVGRWSVKDVMTHEPKALALRISVNYALDTSREWPGVAFPVVDGERLVGLITREALEKAQAEGEEGGTRSIEAFVLQENWVHAHPDHPLEVALERLRDSLGILPVVSRSNTHELVGVISLENVMKTFTYKKSL